MGKKTWIMLGETILIILLVVTGLLLFGEVNRQSIRREEREELQNSRLILYEGPTSLKDAEEQDLENTSENERDFSLMHCVDTEVLVSGHECYVYDTNVNHSRTWNSNYTPANARTPVTYFDFEGAVEIEIHVPNIDISTVSISPLEKQIDYSIDKNEHKVSFVIKEPDTYTVTFNESPERAIHIFANPIEENIPDAEDENVIYIGPGEWDIDSIILEDNQTLYLAGGAVVHGIVNANYAKNITVCGRGIIDGSKFEGWKGKNAYIPLKFDHCQNVTIKDVIVLNSNAWVCQAFDSKDGIIDGIKVISSRPNGDGITLQSCQNYQVKNCFIRSWDDSLVVKNYSGDSKNITFSKMQLWTDLAQSMEIGYETNKGRKEEASITDIRFEDITVLYNFHKPVISIHNADDALVSDILFQNITVEDAQMGSGDGAELPYLIDISITENSNWSSTVERGNIRNVRIDGVAVLSGKFNESRIQGYDMEHTVENVEISNLEILGQKITTPEEGKFVIEESTTGNINIR